MRLSVVFVVVLAFIVTSCCEESKNDSKKELSAQQIEKEKEAVALVLEKYVIANERQNIDLVHEVWASEADIVVFGTNSDEKIIGWEDIKNTMQRQFNTFEETYISVRDQNIKVNKFGCTAWFSEVVNYNYIYNGEAKSFEGLRFTGVLEKKDGDWFIVQSHMSIPGSVD